jgi:predicted cytidylate kinase
MIIITISGLHGTGKSTIGKLVAQKLDIKYYSTGQAFRDIAKEMNLTLEEFTEYVERNPTIDKKLDQKINDIAQEGNVIIDSQLSAYILDKIADLKILLTCPLKVRVRRMAERDDTSYDEKLNETSIREESELERFKNLYNFDLNDLSIYDLIIKTENMSISEIVEFILTEIDKRNLNQTS